jgi:hypothetical protein
LKKKVDYILKNYSVKMDYYFNYKNVPAVDKDIIGMLKNYSYIFANVIGGNSLLNF